MKILGKMLFGLAALASGCVAVDRSILSRYDSQKIFATYIGKELMVLTPEDGSAEYALQRHEDGEDCMLNTPNELLFDAGCNDYVDHFIWGDVTIFRDGTVLPDASSFQGGKNSIEDLFGRMDSKMLSYKRALRVEQALKEWNSGWEFFKKYDTRGKNKIIMQKKEGIKIPLPKLFQNS